MLQKFDPELSSAQAFREAAKDPAVIEAYCRENGITASVRPKPVGLAKAANEPAQADLDRVALAADVLEKSEGLSPTQAYARALSESGVYSGAGAAA